MGNAASKAGWLIFIAALAGAAGTATGAARGGRRLRAHLVSRRNERHTRRRRRLALLPAAALPSAS